MAALELSFLWNWEEGRLPHLDCKLSFSWQLSIPFEDLLVAISRSPYSRDWTLQALGGDNRWWNRAWQLIVLLFSTNQMLRYPVRCTLLPVKVLRTQVNDLNLFGKVRIHNKRCACSSWRHDSVSIPHYRKYFSDWWDCSCALWQFLVSLQRLFYLAWLQKL